MFKKLKLWDLGSSVYLFHRGMSYRDRYIVTINSWLGGSPLNKILSYGIRLSKNLIV